MFFSDLSNRLHEDVKAFVEDAVSTDVAVEAHLFPHFPEKVYAELFIGDGDLYIFNQRILGNVFEILSTQVMQPLDDLSQFVLGSKERYQRVDELTGDTRLYALPIPDNSPFHQALEFPPKMPLVAIITNFNDYEAESINILRKLLE
jgi:hypothetical protein